MFPKKQDPDAPPSYGESSNHAVTSEPTPVEKRPSGSSRGAPRACLMLNRTDLLQTTGFPPDVIQQLDSLIRQTWKKGVQKHRFEDGCWEWKLSGRPWLGQHDDSIPSRRLVLAILPLLWQHGWTLETSLPFFLHSIDRDTLFFKQRPELSAGQRTFFAIDTAAADLMRIWDPPSPDVLGAVSDALRTWPKGLQQEEKQIEPGGYQYKLRGLPWLSYDQAQVVGGREVVCRLLTAMEGVGYELVGTVDMGIGNDSRDGDTMIFGSRT